jgi:hypothetical protein
MIQRIIGRAETVVPIGKKALVAGQHAIEGGKGISPQYIFD